MQPQPKPGDATNPQKPGHAVATLRPMGTDWVGELDGSNSQPGVQGLAAHEGVVKSVAPGPPMSLGVEPSAHAPVTSEQANMRVPEIRRRRAIAGG